MHQQLGPRLRLSQKLRLRLRLRLSLKLRLKLRMRREQEGSKTPKLETRWPQDPPIWSQNTPKSSQVEAKMAPKAPNLEPR